MMFRAGKTIAELRMEQYRQRPYAYGVRMVFEQDKSVVMEAPLVPAGKVLYAWHSSTDYQRDRTEPSLPLLVEGRRYRIGADMDSEPEGTALIRIVFKDRRDNEIGIHMVGAGEDTFIYPMGAYRYIIELIQGGFRRMVFRRILLEEEAKKQSDATKEQEDAVAGHRKKTTK